jgi:hypothetical protein
LNGLHTCCLNHSFSDAVSIAGLISQCIVITFPAVWYIRKQEIYLPTTLSQLQGNVFPCGLSFFVIAWLGPAHGLRPGQHITVVSLYALDNSHPTKALRRSRFEASLPTPLCAISCVFSADLNIGTILGIKISNQRLYPGSDPCAMPPA